MPTLHEQYFDALKRTQIDKSRFAYVGVIGSLVRKMNGTAVANDVDVMILPKAGIPIGEIEIGMNAILDEADAIAEKDYGIVTSRCGRKADQERTKWLIEKAQGASPLDVHTLMFTDRQSFYKLNPQSFLDSMKGKDYALHGNLSDAVDTLAPSIDQKQIEAIIMLNDFNVLQTAGKFPKELTERETKSLVHYLSKWYGVTVDVPTTPEECKKLLQNLIKGIDRTH